MSTTDLIVLSILLNHPQNAYELIRFIKDRRVDRVLKVSEPGIFKSCRRLADGGYLDGETIREPGVPDKVVYQINAKGRKRMLELMAHFANHFKMYFFDFNTVIWGVENMAPNEGRELLKTLQGQLHGIKSGVIAHEQEVADSLPFGSRQIVKQYRMTISCLVEWIDEVVVDFEAMHKMS